MKWNWEQPDWRNFSYDAEEFYAKEDEFLLLAGKMAGINSAISTEQSTELVADLITEEALLTSRIEGEYLQRPSIKDSIRAQLGLKTGQPSRDLREEGVTRMLLDVYSDFNAPLDHDLVNRWHGKLMHRILDDAGSYRTFKETMRVVSNAYNEPVVHFEAPPSAQVPEEMSAFISWFNQAHEQKKTRPLTLAAISHLWFECIHPYSDGNGRVGRAMVEYSLSRSLGHPTVLSLSSEIEKKRQAYYDALEQSNRDNEINHWLRYFISLLLNAQKTSLAQVEFILQKAKFYDKFDTLLNARQHKAVARIFREGLSGFTGGLSAKKYLSITQASEATTTRDLNKLVSLGAFTKTGGRKNARYWIKLE